MVDILHGVGIKASPAKVYAALTTIDGLSGWWTTDTQGEAQQNGVIKFRFGSRGGFDMKVVEARPNEGVTWKLLEGPAEWLPTQIRFELRQSGDYTMVLFKHAGWKEPVDFMHHCSTKWGTFLMSLKALVETGTGAPFPRDVKIDDFN